MRAYFTNRAQQMEDVISRAAQVLSGLTHYTSLVMSPKGAELRIRTLQLVPVSSQSALLVIVTDGGIMRDSVIRVGSEMDSDALYAVSRTVPSSGKTSLKDIKAPSDELKRGIWLDEHKEKGFAVEGTQQEEERLLYSGVKFDKDKEVSTNFYSAVTIAGDKLKKLESRIEKGCKRKHRTGKKRYCRCKTACR